MGNTLRAASFGIATVLAAGIAQAACSSKSTEPLGALVVAASSDMAIPKDIDHVGVSINVGNRNVFSLIDRVYAGGALHLPATIAVVAPKDGSQAVANIRIVGFSKGKAIIVRDARVGIPTTRRALFRLPLYFLSVGSGSGDQEKLNGTPTASRSEPTLKQLAVPGDLFGTGLTVKCGPTADSSDRGGECVSMDF